MSDSDTTDAEMDQKKLASSFLISATKDRLPRFEITVRRKFEIAELCQVFVNKYLKYAYLVLVGLFCFLACWTFATVAGTAWSINIPFRHFGAATQCTGDAFFHNVLPSGGCLYAYYFCLALFAIIVITLSLFDLKEQAFIQLILGVLRFFTVGAILIYCVVRLAQGGDACVDQLRDDLRDDMEGTNATMPVILNVGMRDMVVKYDIKGLVMAIPVFTFAFLFHTGISSLTHPVKQKKYLHWLLMAMFLASTVAYLSLGVIVPLWFRASIQETCTLNWVSSIMTHLILS